MSKILCTITIWAAFAMAAHGQVALPTIALNNVSNLLPTQALIEVELNLPQLDTFSNTASICNTVSACSSSLPVTSMTLQGTRLNNYQVALFWKTINETLSKGFNIERSLGDADNFQLAGSMASNTSNAVEKNYKQTDLNSYSGNTFYRIKQLDLNGNFTYSNTIEVRGYTQKENILLSPNPASGQVTITCYSIGNGNSKMSIFSAHGQNMAQYSYTLFTGSNQFILPISNYLPGLYFVQMLWPDGYSSTIKLVVK